jgi:hypothetical protein
MTYLAVSAPGRGVESEDLLDLVESPIQCDPPVFTPEEQFLRTQLPN